MKINPKFILRQVADTWVVLALSDANINFNGMLSLNESGVMLWNLLEQGCTREDLVAKLTGEYIVTAEQAQADVDEFIAKLAQAGCFE